ncbi:putative endonuclease of the XPG family [Acanthamoeba polyphaga moumouvirus]|uniref:Putative endonuclease of the XPG family n=1 Tax=Acanthamoeba polyphaga moumouvirus TaxID=1269028 RepID=L7RG37_9VIRU|nr:putative endonuclease of the XPG family [Acanthamoeba polyphaga moumouvirus]AGC01970.1 putative endonuclease of the XPG family [Acanthamoeba polyphaga moumouvirus]
MGIKGLPKLIREITNGYAVRSYNFSKFHGMKVSVDMSLLIHQTVIAMRSNGKDMKNRKGELTSHLYGILYKMLVFLQNGMTPICVFDGKAPDIKNKTVDIRRSKKDAAEKKLEDLDDSEDEEYIKNFKQTFTPSKRDIQEAQILLDLMGIPYIVAPGEADVVCSWLAARRDENGDRYVKGVCSDDSDMLALGAPYLFKDMLKFMSKNKEVTIISLNKTLTKTGLTMRQFTDLCVLLGCDYCDNIKGIGPKTAYNKIKECGSLEEVIKMVHKKREGDSDSDNEQTFDLTENDKCMIEARNYFYTALDKLDKSKDFILTDEQLELRKFQYEELMDFMCVKHDFDVMRIQTALDRLKKYQEEMKITRENTKKVHKIIRPRNENYVLRAQIGDIEFLSSDESDNENVQPVSKKIISKKNRNLGNLIRNSKYIDSE